MSPARPPRQASPRRARDIVALALAATVLVTGCAATTIVGEPSPTPTDIIGIADALRMRGVTVSGLVSGDAGCDDPDMIGAAIRFSASGVDQGTPVTARIYIFRNDRSYQKLRPAVDSCAADWVSDPLTFEAIDVSPYVLAGQGPWGAGFRDAVRTALTEAAGGG
jgi:hypothetical protein